MLGYATSGTNDLEKACAFYDDSLGADWSQRIAIMIDSAELVTAIYEKAIELGGSEA
ncbi:MAG: hypothetical protein ACI9VI_000164 [Candidatus Azotimanducaceae bacterium]|jgi:hypothetical protein